MRDARLFLGLMRALIPRWNFFDAVGTGFSLFYRLSETADWTPIDFQQKRSWSGLFSNAQTNLALLQIGLIEQFATDALTSTSHPDRLTSFHLVQALVRQRLLALGVNGKSVQFKVVASNASETQDVFVSDWIEVRES